LLPATDRPLAPNRHLYLHIPFCRHKCGYCDFNAYAGIDRLIPDYVRALVRELHAAKEAFAWEPLKTVYLGGGTPSLIPADQIRSLLSAIRTTFDVETGAEVTLEANPASTDEEKLVAWREGGVNRLSLGVQGFDPRALAVLERKTDGAQAVRAYTAARRAGFDNINLDLIFAVPFQDAASWRDTLRRAIGMRPEHISGYGLTFEPGTLLTRRLARGLIPEVPADRQWDLLDIACEELAAAGYERYEVSNWALPGYESRHNTAYWECRPVYGAGAGAHSYGTDGQRAWRWWNVAKPRDYITASPDVRADGEELDERKAIAERLMLGLRRAIGVADVEALRSELDELEAAGLVVWKEGRVKPTRRGMDLHNQIALAVL
jgi:oxygen-independent coproporphyrinogen-3 oxidase